MDLTFCYHRISDQPVSVQIFFMQVYGRDLMIIVCCIVIDPFCRITA